MNVLEPNEARVNARKKIRTRSSSIRRTMFPQAATFRSGWPVAAKDEFPSVASPIGLQLNGVPNIDSPVKTTPAGGA